MEALQTITHHLFSQLSLSSSFPTTSVRSRLDGEYYTVRDMPDKQSAADMLARIRQKVKKFYNYLLVTYPEKPQIKQLRRNFKPEAHRLLEATPDADHVSYSVDKGSAIHLCLRHRNSGDEDLVHENIIMFVTLHEMAHVITPSRDHEPEFWNNFGWLLKEAETNGYYKHENFSAHPVQYCGIRITDAPVYDPSKDGNDFSIGRVVLS